MDIYISDVCVAGFTSLLATSFIAAPELCFNSLCWDEATGCRLDKASLTSGYSQFNTSLPLQPVDMLLNYMETEMHL